MNKQDGKRLERAGKLLLAYAIDAELSDDWHNAIGVFAEGSRYFLAYITVMADEQIDNVITFVADVDDYGHGLRRMTELALEKA